MKVSEVFVQGTEKTEDTFISSRWCRERDLNPHPIAGLGPQPSAYANSAIAADGGVR